MEVQHVSPSSWQPLLCVALLDELQPLCRESNGENASNVFSYLNGWRGRSILEILALAQWKGLSNASAFLRVLVKAWKLMQNYFASNGPSTDNGICMQEFDVLLSPACEDFLTDINVPETRVNCRRCDRIRRSEFLDERKTRHYVKKRRDLNRLHSPVGSFSSDEEELLHNSGWKSTNKQGRQHRSSVSALLLGFPVVQEDSDGFPASWCDSNLSTITEGVRMNVDDIILPMIRATLPRKLQLDEDDPAVILVLLTCLIRKTLPYMSTEADCATVWNFVDAFLATYSLEDDTYIFQKECGTLEAMEHFTRAWSSRTVSTLKRELLVRRHGIRTLISALKVLKAHHHCERLATATNFMLRNLRIICQCLSAAPLAFDYFELLRTEGCMEYLLEIAADVVIGIFRMLIFLVSSTRTLPDENIFEISAVTTFLLDLCKEASLDELVRDVCIGLDLLATVDSATSELQRVKTSCRPSADDNFGHSNESTARSYLDNVYRAKLFAILFHTVALINALQRLRSMRSHFASCVKSSHQLCCVLCHRRHHIDVGKRKLSPNQNENSPSFSPSSRCAVAFVEKIIFSCLRNVTGLESKEMCIEALESYPSCCCVSKLELLTILFEVYPEFSPLVPGRDSLLKCFFSKLTMEPACGKDCGWTCSFCSQSNEAGGNERFEGKVNESPTNDAFAAAWARFEEKISNDAKEMFFLLFWRIFASSDEQLREKVVRGAVIPALAKWCQDQLGLLKLTKNHLPSREIRLFSLLISLSEMGVRSAANYNYAVEQLLHHADRLFHHPDTRAIFLRLVRRIAVVEWDVLAAEKYRTEKKNNPDYVFNRFLFNKYYLVGKLILNDTQNFVSDAASEFWATSVVLLETCRDLLANSKSTNSFRLIFTDFGGFTHTGRIIEATAHALISGGSPKPETGEKSNQKLAELLSDTIGLCLSAMLPEDKISILAILSFCFIFASLQSLIGRTSTSAACKRTLIFLTRRLMDVALKPCECSTMEVRYKRLERSSAIDATFSPFSLNDEANYSRDWTTDGGYDGDTEGSRQFMRSVKVVDKSAYYDSLRETQSQAKLCAICLELLSALYSLYGESMTDDDGFVSVILKRLCEYCSARKPFAEMLVQEECVALLLKLAEQTATYGLDATCSASLNIIFEFFKLNPQRLDLRPVLRLFNDRDKALQDKIIACFLSILAGTPFEPTSYLNFPQQKAESTPKLPTTPSRRSRSISPLKSTLSVSGASERRNYEQSRHNSVTAAVNPFVPFFSGLSSLFAFGSGPARKQSKHPSAGSGNVESSCGQTDAAASSNKVSVSGGGGGAFALCPEAAFAFSLDEAVNCSLWTGLSVGMWTCFEIDDDNSEMNSAFHLVTVGDKTLSCSLYVKRSNKAVLIRLFICGMLVAEFTRTKFIPLDKWTHLLLVVSSSKSEQLTIKVLCDGARQTTRTVPFSSELKTTTSPYVCFGTSTTRIGRKCVYRLGNFAGFRGELSLEHSILLRALGPSCVTVCDTKSRRLDGDLASFVNAGLLLSREEELNIAILLEDRLGLMEQLQKNQLFIFTPSDSDRVYFYSLDSIGGPSFSGSYDHGDVDLCRKFPIAKVCSKQTATECVRKFRVDDAFTSLGGVKLFIYLFARAVEYERSEECQASALLLIQKAAFRNPKWCRAFLDLRGYMIIARVLPTSYCQRGYKLLEVIFDFALNVNPFRWPANESSRFSMSEIPRAGWKPEIVNVESATIKDPFALTCFLLDPDIWKDSDALSVWQTGVEIVLRLLTQPAPTVATFNACQLNKAKFLKYLFYTLTEKSQDPFVRLSSNAAVAVSTIALHLIGSPPNVFELTACWDFVFLTHPASSTYLNYRIGGPSEWLDPGSLVEPVVSLDNYESRLGTKLRQIMNAMGKTAFIEWIGSEEMYTRLFSSSRDSAPTGEDPETGHQASSFSNSETSPASTSRGAQQQQLPDLVCDIDASTAAEMSDSMRTATQSSTSAIDDEVFPADEYIDAASDIGGEVGKPGPTVGSFKPTVDAPWLIETRRMLLGGICHVLAVSSESDFRRIAGSVVKWEHLLVMLRRQNDSVIRIACIKALCILLMRFNEDQRSNFLKANGFSLLANQLRECPCTSETVEDLFSLLCGEHVEIQDGLDVNRLSALVVDRFRAGVIKPLLVAYQNSVDDVALFWNMSSAFCRVFQHNGTIAQTMLESHVGEVLANILLQLSLRHHGETDVVGASESSLMMEGWRSLTSVVLHRCVTRSNIHHHQAFSELLQLVQCAAITSLKFGVEAHMLVRKELCILIQLSLEAVRQSFDDSGTTGISSLTLPPLLSSLSGFASTLLQSGRQTPSRSGDKGGSPLTLSSEGQIHSARSAVPIGTSSSGVAPKRRSSLSASLTSLKEKLLSASQGNLSQVGDAEKLATQSEILDRWKLLLQHSIEYFVFFSASDCFEERYLFDYLLHFAVNTLANEVGARKRGNTWLSLMWSSRTKLQQFLSQALLFILYPAERNFSKLFTDAGVDTAAAAGDTTGPWIRRRLLIVEAWAHEPQAKSLLKHVLDTVPESQSVVTAAVCELLFCDYALSNVDAGNCQKLLALLRQTKAKSPFDEYDNADEIVHNVCWDERTSLEIYIGFRAKWIERMKNFAIRLRGRHQTSAQSLSDDAMAITCAVVGEQNLPRKLFIQLKKQASSELLVAEENLRNLVTDLCHPAGSCFDVLSWPSNWRLDPTEGPHRERRRLMPSHLNILDKFVLPDFRGNLALAAERRPLVKLLSGSAPDSVAVSTIAGQLLERLRIEDKIIFNCSAVVVRTSFECEGELLLGDRALYFVGESSRSSQKGLPLDSVISMNWPYYLITALHTRYFQLIDLALEIFFADGETYLIAFETMEKRDLFLSRLVTMDLPNLTTYSEHLLQTLTAWWREGNITNFQYLMQLNTLAGRTFNDLMQYPIFPFVLSDYTSIALNLNSLAVYRNLAKPIAIQDLQMESHYLHVYRSLENDFKRHGNAISEGMPIIGAYHYGSHYSNSGIVVHYLVRLPPFTQLVLEYQDNNFDLPDRTFHSISTAYRLSTSESTTDFKELIPEFFFLSEFLTNREGLNLGRRQNGQSISDVELPPWCPNADPRLFIFIHRQALESAYVSAHLHEWVDLIFGYKQVGQSAIDAINIFHPATYHGTLAAAADSDEIRLKALNTMVKTYGQMPKQLFKTPHLPHMIAQNYLAVTHKQQPESPLLSVNGIRWGHYVGSPELPEPSLVLKQRNHGYGNLKPSCLTCLADGSCVGYPAATMPVVLYGSVKKDLWLANVREVERIFVVHWDFGDKIVRLRSVFPPDHVSCNWTNAIALHEDEIICYASCSGSPEMIFGMKTGVILVYKVEFGNEGLKGCGLVRSLYGHRSSPTAIDVCYEYSVFVTGSESGECFVWDYNKLCFVLALTQHVGPVTHVCISRTTCDIATVALKGWGSELVLHTVNGRVVGSVETDIVITSVTMSSAPEGTAVNCIAAGMQNGLIRLWNMWTLAPMREICHTQFLEPIVSLSYSHNSLKLYACTKTGAVLCWDSGASKQVRPPRFFFLNVNH